MRFNSLKKNAVVCGLLLVLGCRDERRDPTNGSVVSYAPREAGSAIAPTNELSYHLLAMDGPDRLWNLRALLVANGKECRMVTSAVLLGGMDETDEWRVSCLDTGTWTVWFKPVGVPEIEHCAAAACKD